MFIYHYTLTPDDNNTFLIQFPDIPEAAAVAESAQDAPEQAAEGLEAALQLYIDARRPIPEMRYAGGDGITLKASATAKLLLSDAMVSQGVRKADLARILEIHPPQVDRLLDLGHSSKIEMVEDALSALGEKLLVSLA
ncbi:type II toxin-antitoxin system HicB family antitoxin [Allopusillimonas ginsengisoli]|uniref:type II toxin-antitoxin system HicB family antitoxin n=1 Tax=Allopusillimonas ginsengisoli TaxID=453575 RepID=UPI00101FAD45|nr:type II toxin-antitoxin system HicB family antitoxin [Allopusillimonas ginsengisoli]TEA79626.1 type II toxin-antitoxin system HicB family antitoxin [Allopusillimonas ginsengisoli]